VFPLFAVVWKVSKMLSIQVDSTRQSLLSSKATLWVDAGIAAFALELYRDLALAALFGACQSSTRLKTLIHYTARPSMFDVFKGLFRSDSANSVDLNECIRFSKMSFA